MTIECYYDKCPNHAIHLDSDEGPFCYQNKCTATEEQTNEYAILRNNYLKENNRTLEWQ